MRDGIKIDFGMKKIIYREACDVKQKDVVREGDVGTGRDEVHRGI